MLDIFSYWDVRRLNPESPAPLLNITNEEYKLWWAANVAANIWSLNWSVNMIWILWDDSYWKLLKKQCDENNITLHPIVWEYPTITKQRFIENTYEQQLLRVDYEKIYQPNENFNKQIIQILQEIQPKYIIISDYNKWIINESLIKNIKDFSEKNNTKILWDIKPFNAKHFNNIYLIKPNFKEFCEIIGKQINNEEAEIVIEWKILTKEMNANLVVTRGKKWAILIRRDWTSLSIPTEAQQVFDVTWAWDTFIATIAWALANWHDLEISNNILK